MTKLFSLILLIVVTQYCCIKNKSDSGESPQKLLVELITDEKELSSFAPFYHKVHDGKILLIQINNNLLDTVIIPYTKVYGVKWYSPETVGYLSVSLNKDTILGESRLTVSAAADNRDTLFPGEISHYFIEEYYWTEQNKKLKFAQFSFPFFMNKGINENLEFLTNLNEQKDSLHIIHLGKIEKGEEIDIGIGHMVTLY
ncbi:hypothetical protein [Lewinella cohaerens]|uniref:hypothetical protein n=1 Tax=Lewinella cohaerens TaxID=70995 RepID=UPI00039DFC81|nr:hypothetical protein [Lewinella cohaerens]